MDYVAAAAAGAVGENGVERLTHIAGVPSQMVWKVETLASE